MFVVNLNKAHHVAVGWKQREPESESYHVGEENNRRGQGGEADRTCYRALCQCLAFSHVLFP